MLNYNSVLSFIESNALEMHWTPRDGRVGRSVGRATFFEPMREEISFSISQ